MPQRANLLARQHDGRERKDLLIFHSDVRPVQILELGERAAKGVDFALVQPAALQPAPNELIDLCMPTVGRLMVGFQPLQLGQGAWNTGIIAGTQSWEK